MALKQIFTKKQFLFPAIFMIISLIFFILVAADVIDFDRVDNNFVWIVFANSGLFCFLVYNLIRQRKLVSFCITLLIKIIQGALIQTCTDQTATNSLLFLPSQSQVFKIEKQEQFFWRLSDFASHSYHMSHIGSL